MRSSGQNAYIRYFEHTPHPRLYASPWWLDAVCGADRWNVILSTTTGDAPAMIPYFQVKLRGLNAAITPPYTQWIVVCGVDSDSAFPEKAFQQLSAIPFIDLSFSPDQVLTTAIAGANITTAYSYVLPWSEDMAGHYNENLRRNLREASSIYTTDTKEDANAFLPLFECMQREKGARLPRDTQDILPRLIHELYSRACGELLFAYEKGKAVAAVLIARDDNHAYYIAGGRSAHAPASAHALLLHKAIMYAQDRNLAFDFEGSMIPGVATFFQSFGGTPVPYSRVRKYSGIGKLYRLFYS